LGEETHYLEKVVGMAKKKNTSVSVSQEDNMQAQPILEQYHQIANTLHVSTDQKQAEAALTDINALPEGAQIALLKALSKENHVDAADVLTGIYDLSPLKTVRKEAKRSLIRLESAKIYPNWEAPIDRTPLVSLIQPEGNPPRFWKGIVTDSRDMDEVQLILCWEQGEDYKEVRVISFLLEFGHDGVKNALSQVESKRSFEKYLAHMIASLDDVKTKSCTLTQGRSLLLEALEVNKQRGTTPHKDYRFNLSLIRQLIIDAPDLEDDDEPLFVVQDYEYDEEDEEDEDEEINLHDLQPSAVVSMFVEYHVDGDFGVSYDLLTQDSPLREGLSRQEWIERRKEWEQTANPGEVEPNLLFEHEQPKSRLWLPGSVNVGSKGTSTVIEAGWSAEMDDTPLGEMLPELPTATAVYEETRRHWFWASYSLVKENDEWRLHSISDEGLNSQKLSINELQGNIEEINVHMNDFTKKHPREAVKHYNDEETLKYVAGTFRYVMKSLYYHDVLIKKLPLDRALYESAAQQSLITEEYERSLVYLLPLLERFPEKHAALLRQIAEVYQKLSAEFLENDDDERSTLFDELTEGALLESLKIENSLQGHMALAELLLEDDDRLDDARHHLLQAKSMNYDQGEEAHIEIHLGQIATAKEEYAEALTHYQRALQLRPEVSTTWYELGTLYKDYGQVEKAIASYEHAIELEPDNGEYYYTLSKLYTENGQSEKSLEILKNALDTDPDSIDFNIFLALFYADKKDYDQAELFVRNAERIDPEAEVVQILRALLFALKTSELLPPPSNNPPRKFLQKKKKGDH
jgi:tetratricopeptide (TPR) repeat protein